MAKVDITQFMAENFKVQDFKHLHWRGNFQDYLEMVYKNTKITRNAFQRIHDMILSFGTSRYTGSSKK
jgi:serine protein kinase